ncbi:MAG: diadenylate cyclase CdaA [Clostridia bacterium]|nr:diadenylate cyclase CdaA [Clostridia bacterium]
MGTLMAFWDRFRVFWGQYVLEPFREIGVLDIFDILILAALLYYVYSFSRARRAGRVLIGLLVVVVVSMVVMALELPALSYIIRLFASSAFFCFVLIFQPEIRDALERIGNSKPVNPASDTIPKRQLPAAQRVTEETVDAVFRMASNYTGALIVFEGLTPVGDFAESGKPVDAMVTSHLLQNIFYDKAPLHDGATVIRDMRIWRASCVLPTTHSAIHFENMGTRHRAAVGLTEVSDALVVVVSEESGIVSVAQDGKLIRNVDRASLTDILMTYMAGSLYLRMKRQDAKAAKAAKEWADKTEAMIAEQKKQIEESRKAAASAKAFSEAHAAEPDTDLQETAEGGSEKK